MRLFGRRRSDVKRLAAKGDLEGLVTVLEPSPEAGDRDVLAPREVRRRVDALDALGRLYGPKVEEGVRIALADPSPDVRLAAVRAARTAGLVGVANGLVAGLVYWEAPFAQARAEAGQLLDEWQVPDLPERLAVVLAQNGGRELADEHDLLLRTWMHEDPRPLPVCQDAVGTQLVGWLVEPDIGRPEAERAGELLATLDGGGIRALSDLVWGSDPPLSALHIAAQLRDNRLIEPLVSACRHERRSVRELSVKALGAIEDSRAVGVLLHATRDSDHGVRHTANQALEGMGVAAVIFGLAATIKPELTRDALHGAEDPDPEQLAAGYQGREAT